MNIAVFGLGYVGCVSAACLADLGHSVIGVDVSAQKLAMIRDGHPPIIEAGLDSLLARVVREGRLSVTAAAEEAIAGSELSMVCVGTPSQPNGNLDVQHVERVLHQIGLALTKRLSYHVVAVRSTLLPGILSSRVIPILEAASGKKAGAGFGICLNPEFLRESSALRDFTSPPFTLIGELDARSGDVLAKAYEGLSGPIYRLDPDAAAMVKYASNAYHALKVAFANEIGALCSELKIDSHRVMDVFVQDRSLNVSAAYLRPGFAFGGSCLPKDLRALLYAAKHQDIQLPLLAALLPSNDLHIQRVVDLVTSLRKKRVALVGLSFKPGTDDLRESPLVRLAETLIGKGFRLTIYDEDVSVSNLFGRNREYIEQVLPHLGELLRTNLQEVLSQSEVLLIGKRFPGLEQVRAQIRTEHIVVDLVKCGSWQPALQANIV